MSAAHQASLLGARGAPMAKAGVMAGFGEAVLFAVPTALVGAALVYGLFKAFEVRWDEFSRRAADGESTMEKLQWLPVAEQLAVGLAYLRRTSLLVSGDAKADIA